MSVPEQRGEMLAQSVGSADRTTRVALLFCAVCVVVSLGFRLLYLLDRPRVDLTLPPAFLAAEGLVGIMARHIVDGAWPVFYYGQAYLGAFEAYLAAVVFHCAGSSVTALRLVPTIFAVAWIPLAGVLAGRLYGRRAGFLAAALVALPSQFAFEWGFVAWGGHANVAMILLTLCCFTCVLQRRTGKRLLTLGFVTGFALWVNQLTIAYLPAYGAVLAWLRPRRREIIAVGVAALVGSAPLVYGNVVIQPLGTVRNLVYEVGLSWRLGKRMTNSAAKKERFYRSVPLFQVLGAQPHRDGRWSVHGSAAAGALVVLGLVGGWKGLRRRGRPAWTRLGTALVLACAGVSVLVGAAGFFGQPVGRYHLPLYPLLCVLAARALSRMRLAGLFVVAFITIGNAARLASPPPSSARTETGAVIEAMLQRGLHHGYGADNMYDLIFESGEQIVIEPVEWSRYAPYGSMVAAADRIFYLYRTDQQGKISYRVFMEYLHEQGMKYQRLDIGDYHVLFDFEPRQRLSRDVILSMRAEIRARKRARAKGGRPAAAATER